MLSTPLILMILDGFGYRENPKHNAIAAANTPQWDFWWKNCPHVLLEASGCSVGLPDEQMGNSEVGHMHIGAGRRIPQDFTRINEAIISGDFQKNARLLDLIQTLKKNHGTLHVLGLLSPGGVHSHENHLFAFLALCHEQQFNHVALHLVLDGRDVPPQSALSSIKKLNDCLKQYPVATIVSLVGRYYAMDRDKRWERIEPVYQMLTESTKNLSFETPEKAIQYHYEQGIYDEFMPPTLIGTQHSIKNGDGLFCFNFRADRMRQLTQAFLNENFEGFHRQRRPQLSSICSMTQYAKDLKTDIVFPPLNLKNTFGEIIANAGLRQLRLAETEKYAHVTFFFNGGSEHTFPQETRILIPSPRIKTYDLQPEMSAKALTQTIIQSIEDQAFDVIICNYANADMVGHTGNMQATIKAIECLDACMQDVADALAKVNGHLFITADHGNAESMYDVACEQPQTAHTSEPVPFLYVGNRPLHFKSIQGNLGDIAPTLLDFLNLKQPAEMTGESLLDS